MCNLAFCKLIVLNFVFMLGIFNGGMFNCAFAAPLDEIAETASRLGQLHKDQNWTEAESLLAKLFEGDREFAAQVIAIPIQDPKIERRTHLISGAQRAGLKELSPTLVKLLKDDNAAVRMSAAIALGDLGDEHSIESLEDYLARESDPLRQNRVRVALAKLGRPYLKYFVTGLADRDVKRQRWCINALGNLKDPRAVPHLVKLLADTPDQWTFVDGDHITEWNPVFVASSIRMITGINDMTNVETVGEDGKTIQTKSHRRTKAEFLKDCKAWIAKHERKVNVSIEESVEPWRFTREPMLPGLNVAFSMDSRQVRKLLDDSKLAYHYSPEKSWQTDSHHFHRLEAIVSTESAMRTLNPNLTEIVYTFAKNKLESVNVELAFDQGDSLSPLVKAFELRENGSGKWSGLKGSIEVVVTHADAEKMTYEIRLPGVLDNVDR